MSWSWCVMRLKFKPAKSQKYHGVIANRCFLRFFCFFLLPNRVFNQNSLFIIYVLPFWLLLHLYFALCLVLFHHQVLRLVSIIIILLLLWSGVLVLLRMTYYRRLWLEALCELGLPQQNFKWERENWSRCYYTTPSIPSLFGLSFICFVSLGVRDHNSSGSIQLAY